MAESPRLRIILGAQTLLCLAALLTGCSLMQDVKGQYYLKAGSPEAGLEAFRAQLAENPADPKANYYLGRIHLSQGAVGTAITHLSKAVQTSPATPDYRFWLGLAQGKAGDTEAERSSYEQVLEQDPDHLRARLYLAHIQLKAGQTEAALGNYQRVVEQRPEHPQALYNRALALKRLERRPEEAIAWKRYLDAWPDGPLARQAVRHLNALGDFAYRNHILGNRRVTLEKIRFVPFKAELDRRSRASLDLAGEIMDATRQQVLHIVAYQLNNRELARERAQSVRDFLVVRCGLEPERIRTSWFATAERIEAGGKTHREQQSINLFSLPPEKSASRL